MARPLRLEFSGALYHVTSRGDRREDIFLNDDDRHAWLAVLGLVCKLFNCVVHAYCQMGNHYHLVVETLEGNLSGGMRQFNGQYTQQFNRRHGLVGHLFQGRYKAILVQKEAYLLELARYVVLNPVRAGIVDLPEQWAWSSFNACMNDQFSPSWLETDWLLSQFGTKRDLARRSYVEFVMQGRSVDSPLLNTRYQLLLGDDEFVKQRQAEIGQDDLREVSTAHRRAVALSLADYQHQYPQPKLAMSHAYRSGAYTMSQIADHFGVHYMTVSRAVRSFENV